MPANTNDIKNLMRITSDLVEAHNDLLTKHMLLEQIVSMLPYVVEIVLENCRLCGGCGNSCWHEAKPGDKCEECKGTGKHPIPCETCEGAAGYCITCKGHGYQITKVPIALWVELWLDEPDRRGYHKIRGMKEVDGDVQLSIAYGVWHPIKSFFSDERTAEILRKDST